MTPKLQRFTFEAMGSFCEVQFYSESRITARKMARDLTAEVQRLERKYSRYLDDSVLSAINRSAGDPAGIAIDKETQSLLDHAAVCYRQSKGLFDITSGVLRNIWDFKKGIVPEQSTIDDYVSRIGFDKLNWQERVKGNAHLFLPANMEIDFGGIVKEYAADSTALKARKMGINSGLVNLGGDFSAIGRKPEDEAWPVGIADPNAPQKMIARIDILDGGLASSGDYERCFVLDGKRYSHILNPLTGWPCDGLRAVSVAGNMCTVAGSIATIAMLLPEAEGIAWLQESTLPFIYMDASNEIRGPALQEAEFG